MKQIILDTLNDISGGQINLESKSARELIATLISSVLNSKGTYKEYTKSEIEESKARETWVCGICGENTYNVDYDYIGSGTNHLGCELEYEMKELK
tara:strand:+ start:301 stop:588 length:288 start_codon:yes stop_codon:yes gene_type:complete